jgi:alpha-L-arabinofuranosidase
MLRLNSLNMHDYGAVCCLAARSAPRGGAGRGAGAGAMMIASAILALAYVSARPRAAAIPPPAPHGREYGSGGGGAPGVVVTVHRDQPLLPPLSTMMNGAALEFLNHQAYGGLSSQLVFGESFEEVPFDPAAQASRPAQSWIGCAPPGTSKPGPVPPRPPPPPPPPGPGQGCSVRNLTNETARLNGYCQTHAVVHTGGHCLFRCGDGVERIVDCAAGGHWSSTTAQLCGTSTPHWVAAGTFHGNVSAMWSGFVRGGARATFALATDDIRHGVQAQRVSYEASSSDSSVGGSGAAAGITNHGLDCHWGYHLQAGRDYDGYFWGRAVGGSAPATVSVALIRADPVNRSSSGAVLAEASFQLHSSVWRRFNFTLRPSAGTNCSALPLAGPTSHGLLRIGCAGALQLALHSPGTTVDLDMVFVQDWDRLTMPASGRMLPTRRALAEALMSSGISVMRMGGSMANSNGYRWKQFIGPYDQRQPYAGDWYRDPGCTAGASSSCLIQSRGWGMFELIDMCTLFGVTPIITVNNGELPADMADFVEFAHGDPATTEWGRRRASFGHPAPFNITHVEIGNEQGLTAALALQMSQIATAMDARVAKLRLPFNFSYIFGPRPDLSPQGHWSHNWSDPGLGAIADAMAAFGDRAFWDIHVESKAPEALFDASGIDELQEFLAARGSPTRAVVLEENGCGFSQHCALNHAVLANEYRKRGGFIRANSITNALQAWNEIEQYSQGMLSFLPNGSFAQPTFYANAMFAKHCAGMGELNVSVDGGWSMTATGAHNKLLLDAGAGTVVTPVSQDEDQPSTDTFVVRLVHFGSASTNVTIDVRGLRANASRPYTNVTLVRRVTLAAQMDAINTPRAQNTVVPVEDEIYSHQIMKGAGYVSIGPVLVKPSSLTMLHFGV